MIIKSDYRIASMLDGYGILLRNKHLNDAEHLLPDDTVLFVHGATYGSTSTFDYPIDDMSWMDAMAMAGFDVWCIDLLGYGQSDRPEQMSVSPADNEPLVDTAHALVEVDRAIEFIKAHRNVDTVSLIGYSWGSAICGRYAGQYPENVNRLVLSGALWVEKSTRTPFDRPGAYRTVTAEDAAKRWSAGLTPEQMDSIVSPDLVKQWCEDTVTSDPEGEATGQLRAPAGVVKDFLQYSASDEPWYDPSEISAPTQIVVGELDRETTPDQAKKIFDLLSPNIDKRMTVIGQGTHSLLLENNRFALYSVVAGFLA